ncbi:hypothetical protein RJ641_034413 [Dillenia turbinata]|uniref:Uncharacterized protein n=1 Tax=Dillenia turbinata TaxID=194707 RepID=A0AAN8VUE9_9MAGN
MNKENGSTNERKNRRRHRSSKRDGDDRKGPRLKHGGSPKIHTGSKEWKILGNDLKWHQIYIEASRMLSLLTVRPPCSCELSFWS